MPKPCTFPTLYDHLNTVSISFLTKQGYLKPNQRQSGAMTWSRNGNKTASISIKANTQSEQPYIELDYKCNEVPINYRVQIISAPSNLGKGVVWYFVCPSTGNYCRKLYLVGERFLHREAFRGCMYYDQTISHEHRMLRKFFKMDKAFEQVDSKHFKKYYNGRATKRYLRILRRITKDCITIPH